jgi:hypothetical protein
MVNPRGGRHGEEGKEANRASAQTGLGSHCRDEDAPLSPRGEEGDEEGGGKGRQQS